MDPRAQWLPPRELDARIRALVAAARRQYALPAGCSGAEACARLGLRVRRETLPPRTDGLLVGDCVVVNRALTWPSRVEFTIFHEITHYLLDADGELIEYFTAHLRRDERAYGAAIERCCHQGAAEFLLPHDQVHAALAAQGVSVELVRGLANQAGVSLIATAIQVALCAPLECYVVLCIGGVPSRAPGAALSPPGLVVEYAPTNGRFPLARFSPIPADHLFWQTWHDHEPHAGWTVVPFPSGKRWPCYGEATYLPGRHGGRVLGILAAERAVPQAQLALPFAETTAVTPAPLEARP